MEKINIAELLKDCPKGMELNCTMYENVEFDYIEQNSELVYPIHCLMKINGGYNALVFTRNGCNDRHPNAKCVIFPKGKTTWEGFHRPFIDGDILTNERGSIFIYKGPMYYNKLLADFYCGFRISDVAFVPKLCKDKHFGDISECRFATEKEKQKLFTIIQEHGYKWNEETKTLEKLVEPKFKVGDRIKNKNDKWLGTRTIQSYVVGIGYFTTINDWVRIEDQDNWELVKDDIKPKFKVGDRITKRDSIVNSWIVLSVSSEYYGLKLPNGHEGIGVLSIAEQDDWELVKDNSKPKFKVGDRIKLKTCSSIYTITDLLKDKYRATIHSYDLYEIEFERQDAYELVPNKFDITTLIPYESRVLVRHDREQYWIPAFWGCKHADGYTTTYGWCKYCIPYEGNEYLLKTNNDCDNYYKTWE